MRRLLDYRGGRWARLLIAHAFAREGSRLSSPGDRGNNPEAVDKLAEGIEAEGGEAHALSDSMPGSKTMS